MKKTGLFIDGEWRRPAGRSEIKVINPATGDTIGKVTCATITDLEDALLAAQRGFDIWRECGTLERSQIIRKAAAYIRGRAESIGHILTLEQGKPLREAIIEAQTSADLLDWFAEEGRRTYGRVIPARRKGVMQAVVREPVGPVAAFSPWNFPLSQTARKIGPALAAGCSIIIKPPEETPGAAAIFADAFAAAGAPVGVLNIVYGNPSEISNYLIPRPIIRKVSFTGSVPVGKKLAALAGQCMKPSTMELGGHAPAIVLKDAHIDDAIDLLAQAKFRNAGQVCVSPTRFLIHKAVYDDFRSGFVEKAKSLRIGDGLDPETEMGPLANERRVTAMETLIADAVKKGGTLETGGKRIGNTGYFFEPSVISGASEEMAAMNEEPFGPVALLKSFDTLDEAIAEANRLPFGLAAYAFGKSSGDLQEIADRLETGMLTINHLGLALPETPFGGVKDSGYGSEGGTEALDAYLTTKFVTEAPSGPERPQS